MRNDFIAQDDPLAADRLLDLLEDKYKLLADNPHMGPARPDMAKELRYHPVGNYLLLYRIISGGIELVRVVHGARDLYLRSDNIRQPPFRRGVFGSARTEIGGSSMASALPNQSLDHWVWRHAPRRLG